MVGKQIKTNLGNIQKRNYNIVWRQQIACCTFARELEAVNMILDKVETLEGDMTAKTSHNSVVVA